MKEKLKNHYLSLGPRRFVIGSIIILITMDVIFSYYMKLSWSKMGISDLMLKMITSNPAMAGYELSSDSIKELEMLAKNTFNGFIFIVLLNNLFFYFFYYKKRLWAQGYVLFYAFTNIFLNMFFIFDSLDMGMGWWTYNVSTIFIYLYLYGGIKLLRAETTIPVREKKGR